MPNIKEATEIELALDNPQMYKVLLHNDDYTPMDFVIDILMRIFHKDIDSANDIIGKSKKRVKQFVVFMYTRLQKLKWSRLE